MRVTADRDRCTGSGQCVSLVPEVFDQDDEGIVTLLEPAPAEGDRELVSEAASNCPVQAIRISRE
jgi:ferredoxin